MLSQVRQRRQRSLSRGARARWRDDVVNRPRVIETARAAAIAVAVYKVPTNILLGVGVAIRAMQLVCTVAAGIEARAALVGPAGDG